MTHLLAELKRLIEEKENELFWARFNPEKVASGETDRIEQELKTLKEIYWEMV